MEATITTPGETLTATNYWVANFTLNEIDTEFKLENQRILTIAIYDID